MKLSQFPKQSTQRGNADPEADKWRFLRPMSGELQKEGSAGPGDPKLTLKNAHSQRVFCPGRPFDRFASLTLESPTESIGSLELAVGHLQPGRDGDPIKVQQQLAAVVLQQNLGTLAEWGYQDFG